MWEVVQIIQKETLRGGQKASLHRMEDALAVWVNHKIRGHLAHLSTNDLCPRDVYLVKSVNPV